MTLAVSAWFSPQPERERARAGVREIEKERERGERGKGSWPLDHKSISCQLNSECFACSSVSSLQACSEGRDKKKGQEKEQCRRGRGQGAERCLPESGINFITCLFMGSCPNWVNIDNAQTQQPAKEAKGEGARAEQRGVTRERVGKGAGDEIDGSSSQRSSSSQRQQTFLVLGHSRASWHLLHGCNSFLVSVTGCHFRLHASFPTSLTPPPPCAVTLACNNCNDSLPSHRNYANLSELIVYASF